MEKIKECGCEWFAWYVNDGSRVKGFINVAICIGVENNLVTLFWELMLKLDAWELRFLDSSVFTIVEA